MAETETYQGGCHCGAVRYQVHPRCQRLIDDYRAMRWSADGSGADKRDRRRSHASDADGYRVHYLMPIRRMRTIFNNNSGASE